MNEPGGYMNSSIQQLPYPVGITVLNLCHTDPHHSIDSMLAECRYNVKTTTQAMTALELLQDAKSTIDLVIIDMDEHGMDGLRLLTSVVLRKNMPVIALTTNSLGGLFMEGYKYGLCELLLKPVGIKKLVNIWKHVMIRRENKLNSTCTESSEDSQESKGTESFEDSQEFKGTESSEAPKEFKGTETSEALQEVKENVGHTRKAYKRRGEYNNEINKCEPLKGLNEEDNRPNKRPRVVWTEELHCKFIAAVDMLGIDKAVPKRILELMNDGSLTRENVASHLQKYRLLLKKSSDQTKKAIPLGVGSTHDMQPFSGVSVGNLEPTYFRTPLSGIDDTNSMACNGYISHPTTSFISESAEATEGLQVESHLNITDDINSSLGPEIQEHVDYAMSLVGEGYFDRNFSGMALNAPGNFSQIMQGEHVSIESSPVTFLPEYLLTNSNPGTSSPLGFSYNRGDVGVFNGESTLIINSRESSHGSHTYLQTHDFNDMIGNVNVLASNWGDYPSNTCNSNTSYMDHPFIHHGLGSASAFPFTNDASENFDLKTELNGSYLNDAELRASLGFVNQIQATQPTWQPHTSDATQEPHANIQYTRQSW